MRLVCVLFTFENNTGPTDGRTDRRTDTTSYRDATAHLKRKEGWRGDGNSKEKQNKQGELIRLRKGGQIKEEMVIHLNEKLG